MLSIIIYNNIYNIGTCNFKLNYTLSDILIEFPRVLGVNNVLPFSIC